MLNERQAEFMEALALDMEVWAAHVMASLRGDDVSTDVPESYERLRPLIASEEAQHDLMAVVAEALRGYTHAILAELDGGGRVDGIEVSDRQTRRPLGDGLHELFIAHLFDTGRM